ncbi:hypothetical protein AGRA3207_001080 [Actinomadura graeca]|uniref:Uncharacterized protein n=1 Tax=Actinomadura graeca TaxID=2750812 RepID=A0ABX8QNL5_9ACTN|nr:hypothetical protein [Actinomadura graeca]QXJ20380.1 hypothetical protein AGRA3207_001080 [Actinomadura graeca]
MTGNGQHQLVYRLLLAVDIQGYSKRDVREQLLAQRQLSDALDRAARGVGLDRAQWDKQVGGDGELATLPEGVDPAPVAGDFAIGLAEALREVNGEAAGGRGRLRVRLALHHGTLMAGPFGPAGDAPIVVQRLLDAGPLRRLLAEDAHRDLAYVVSDSLFEDVVQTGFCALSPRAFQPIKVTAKGAVFRGYIHTGRIARDGDAGGGERGGPEDRPAADARVFDFPALVAR